MLQSTLNRPSVLAALDASIQELQKEPDDRRAAGEPPELFGEERAEVLAALQAAQARELLVSSLYPSFEGEPGEQAPQRPLSDWAFISSDPMIGIVQAALDRHLEEQRADKIVTADGAGGGDRRDGDVSVAPSPVTDQWIEGGEASSSDLDDRRFLGAYSETDPRWVNCWIAEGLAWFRKKVGFPKKAATPLPLADNARLVLVGDWGSGLPRARAIAERMKPWIAGSRAEGRETHAVHLGDVYYSGWPREYEKNFLKYWPVSPEQAEEIPSWCLNGNHDMYSGGHGYFGTLLKDDRFARHDGSSYFSLTTNHWEILGLDTAFEDHDLADGQQTWVEDRLLNVSPSKKGLLLSHHQLFSAYESDGPKLAKKLENVLAAGRVRAWFWGHEHRCALYAPHEGVQYARCVGHGGVPVYQMHREDSPLKSPAVYEFRDRLKGCIEPFALFGFAVLDFDGPNIHVSYVDENGVTHKEEDIV